MGSKMVWFVCIYIYTVVIKKYIYNASFAFTYIYIYVHILVHMIYD